VGFIGGSARRA
jgi:hypothetical protein